MSDKIRAALDTYAATETDAFINAENFVDGGIWHDIEEEADRYSHEDVSPAPFDALRAVLDLHKPTAHTVGKASWRTCSHCTEGYLQDEAEYPCSTVTAIAAALGVEP